MKQRKLTTLGMELIEWKHKSCSALFAVEETYATLYAINSKEEGCGHATELLKAAKRYYKKDGKTFGGTIALNNAMKHLYRKLHIREYDDRHTLLGREL